MDWNTVAGNQISGKYLAQATILIADHHRVLVGYCQTPVVARGYGNEQAIVLAAEQVAYRFPQGLLGLSVER